ncbi:hypothetical protein ACFO6R_12640 [Eubacterium multiforme]|uniref:YolD-like protein n=1 Tax=Eubacterium multiforme TaxID=83339 RepID=A0ABT9UW99_9FIRM|nr:hypothetical protein [Eubacterium multiforme]MDQ0150583.1 hypothetical protein [Eubacterium multiforme]
MNKEKVKKLINRYIEDDFKIFDIELYNGPIIGFNYNNMLCKFLNGELQISTPGLLIQIDYRNIKSIAL